MKKQHKTAEKRGDFMVQKKIEKELFTVSEIAKKVGITRNKTWAYIRKSRIKPAKISDNTFYFDLATVSEIRKKYRKKQYKNSDLGDNSVNLDYIFDMIAKLSESNQDLLQKQHEDFEKQQKTIQKLLENQQKIIDQQQETIDYFKQENLALRLENRENRKLLEENRKKQDAISETEIKTEKKRTLWDKLFGK